MSRAEYEISRRVNEASWENRDLDLAGLSCPETTSTTITIPGNLTPDKKPTVMSLRIADGEVTGTPTQIGCRFFGRRDGYEVLTKYETGKETWHLSNRVFLLNKQVAFIKLPTRESKVLIGTNLMASCSPMAKMLKEKVIPGLIQFYGAEVQIVNTAFWRIDTVDVWKNIESTTKDILLNHLDEICNQQKSSEDG